MRNTKHITAGAMTIALSGIILFADRVTVGFFMSFLALPLIVYGYFFGFKSSIVVYFSCILMAFVITGFLPSVLLMAGYGLVGMVFIYALEHKWKQRRIFGGMILAIIPLYIIMIGFFGPFFGFSIPEMASGISSVFSFLSADVVKTLAYVAAAVLALMEVFIIKTSGEIVIVLLMKRFKRSNSIKS